MRAAVCDGPKVGYNFTGFLREELDYSELSGHFSRDTRVHGMLSVVLCECLCSPAPLPLVHRWLIPPSVVSIEIPLRFSLSIFICFKDAIQKLTPVLGLLTVGLGIWALNRGARENLVAAGCGLLSAFISTVYCCIVWKWAADLHGVVKAHTAATVRLSHGTWLLIPVFLAPWAAAGTLLLRVRNAADAEAGTGLRPLQTAGAALPASAMKGRHLGPRPENPRAPERHRPIYTWFPEPEGEFMTDRVGHTPPPSEFFRRGASDSTAYPPSTGTTTYPPPSHHGSHYGHY